MNLDSFIVIANKPDSAEVCKGCVMDEWPANHEEHYAVSRAEAIRYSAKYLTTVLQPGEEGYTITLVTIKDGQFIVYEWDNGYICSIEGDELDDLIKEISAQVRAILLTIDGQGKAAKVAALEELLERARQEARP